MRHKTMACAGIAALLTMGAQGAELAPIAERADFTPDECSIGLWVRFDGGWFAPDESQGSPSAAFALRRGNRSARCAEQYVKSLVAKEARAKGG